MAQVQDTSLSLHNQPIERAEFTHRLKFGEDKSFQNALRKKVDAFFAENKRKSRDNWQMYLKSAVVLSLFTADYIYLVFYARNLLAGLAAAVFLGLCMAGIGFNIQHDAGHNAFSRHGWINQLMSKTLDLIGGSSYFWRWKHTVIHHTYVNITGYDTDIEVGPWLRMTPHQAWRPVHRWQHLYFWPLYGLLTIRWQLIDDFGDLVSGRIGPHRVARPGGRDLAMFIAGKSVFLGWMFAVPMLFHRIWVVGLFYLVISVILGTLLSLVFQLPHCVPGAEFPLPDGETGRIKNPWAVHQARATLDFGRGRGIQTWLLGGLNYHREHHLFPVICHVNYPAISRLVDETCREFGVKCLDHESFLPGVAGHYRWLCSLGGPVT